MEMSAKNKSRGSMSNGSGSTSTTAVERKEIERRRRQQMKSLCVKLASLIPKDEHHSSKDAMTQLGSLDEAATYIKKLKERVEELRQKRNSARLLAAAGRGGSASTSTSAATTTASGGAGSSEDEAGHREDMPAVVEVRQHSDGSSLDVVLISSVERPFKLHEVVTVPPCWRKKAPRPSTPTSPSPAPKSSTPSTAGPLSQESV